MNEASSSHENEPVVQRRGQGVQVTTRPATEEEKRMVQEALKRLAFSGQPPNSVPSSR